MMKRISLLFLVLAAACTVALAQRKNDQRTLTTKIADVLAELPAKDGQQLEAHMKEIAAMGKEGLLEMAGMLSAPGQGDNSGLEYALGGFSFYAMQEEKEGLRKMSVEAYCQALQQAADKTTKAFFIRQLQVVGKDDAVSCLQTYLQDDQLCAPAAKALVNIHSREAQEALLLALNEANMTCRLSLVQALGDTRYREAVVAITPLTGSEDDRLRKLALYALANIAAPASEEMLAEAAQKDAFVFDSDNATAAYLLYAERLWEEGNFQLAEKIARSLLDKTPQDEQVQTRTAALALLTDLQGAKSVPQLVEAMENNNPEYRAAALAFAADFITPATTAQWVKKARRSDARIEAEIIRMLGENHATAALPAILKALRSKKEVVKLAAIDAAGRLGGEEALAALLKTMRKGEREEIKAVREALYILDVESLPRQVADALPKMTAEGKVALLTVLGKRAASERVRDVFAYVKSKDSSVRMAALSALPQMVTKDQLPQLFAFLNETSQPEELSSLQQAIVEAVRNEENVSRQAALVLEQMSEVPEEKKSRYFGILASIGGEQALDAVASAFESGNATTKNAAIKSLSAWRDVSAAKPLLHISRNTENKEYLDQAIKGYVRTLSLSDYPAAQKLLMLRKAMEVAKSSEQQKLILKELGNNKIFPAIVFAGSYLEEPGVQQEAAHAVMNIALSSKDFHGEVIRKLLNKTLQVLEGADSEYQKKAIQKFLDEMPEGKGFVSLFNGQDLSGWKGLVGNPVTRAKMDKETLARKQKGADEEMLKGWKVEQGALLFTGKGNNIATVNQYGDIEMFVDWKIYDDGHKEGDAGIYLRGTPQVQMWDTSRVNVGAQVGSGGLYNNQRHPSDPLKVADNPLGEWNTFRILMQGDRVTVYLNGELVTDNVILENYWDRSLPIFPKEQIELQAHGSRVAYRDIYIREIPRPEPYKLSAEEQKEGFKLLFDGTNMHHWMGNTKDYVIEDGVLVVRKPEFGSGGNLYTRKEYSDFIFRFEFKLTPGANNGLGIRAPLEGDPAYEGMELQILHNDAGIYKNLKEYQYHGSVYGLIPAKRGYLKPPGEWNYQEVIVKGPQVKVVLNGETILDGNIEEASKNGTLDGKDHPGLKKRKGHIGFLGHGSTVWFRNIRVKDLGEEKLVDSQKLK
jgi:HEAT repeat protein